MPGLNDKLSLNQQGGSRLAKDYRSIRGIIGLNDTLSTNKQRDSSIEYIRGMQGYD